MKRLEVSGAVRPLNGSLGVKGLISLHRFSRNSLFQMFYVVSFCTKFNQNRSRNTWSAGRINYSLRKIY